MADNEHASSLAAQLALAEENGTLPEGMGVSDAGPDDEPPAEAVTACPDCASASIEYHAGTAFGGEPASAPWTCQDCGAEFEAPIERSPERESGSCRHGPAKSLVDAEPDDIRTDGGTIRACPECDSPSIRTNGRGGARGGGDTSLPDYLCQDCDARFDEPVDRPARHDGDTRNGLAKSLVEADPDDLVTDGGQVAVCPACGAHDFSPRVGSMRTPASEYRYGCSRCGTEFDTPERREREGSAPPLPETQQALLDADPDAVLPDGGEPR